MLPGALQKEARAYLASEKEIPDIKTTTTIMPGKQYDFGNVSFVIGTTGGMSRLIIDGYSLIEEGKKFGGYLTSDLTFMTIRISSSITVVSLVGQQVGQWETLAVVALRFTLTFVMRSINLRLSKPA